MLRNPDSLGNRLLVQYKTYRAKHFCLFFHRFLWLGWNSKLTKQWYNAHLPTYIKWHRAQKRTEIPYQEYRGKGTSNKPLKKREMRCNQRADAHACHPSETSAKQQLLRHAEEWGGEAAWRRTCCLQDQSNLKETDHRSQGEMPQFWEKPGTAKPGSGNKKRKGQIQDARQVLPSQGMAPKLPETIILLQNRYPLIQKSFCQATSSILCIWRNKYRIRMLTGFSLSG